MSTRANVILEKGKRSIYLYRHSDGYPDGLGEDLKKCISNNPMDTLFNIICDANLVITDGIHGDVEYIYTIDLNNNKISYKKV